MNSYVFSAKKILLSWLLVDNSVLEKKTVNESLDSSLSDLLSNILSNSISDASDELESKSSLTIYRPYSLLFYM